MQNIYKTHFNRFTWYNVLAHNEKEIRFLRDTFSFSKSHLTDITAPPLRPKIEFAQEYIFILLLFPIFNKKTKNIEVTEVDVFINKDYVVTYHQNNVNALKDFSQKMESIPDMQKQYRNSDSINFFLDILEEIALSLYPMLNHISWDIDALENQLFTGRERQLIRHILLAKKNIVDMRKSLQLHGHVLQELSRCYKPYFPRITMDETFGNLITLNREIWEHLESHKATIDAVQQTNESLITFRLNDIMKTLTIFSVIVFPLTLLAAIFGMNTLEGMPFVQSHLGFWRVIGIMVLGTMTMFYIFKKHKWL